MKHQSLIILSDYSHSKLNNFWIRLSDSECLSLFEQITVLRSFSSLTDLSDSNVGAEEIDRWRDAWAEAASGHVEFEVPLRLLTTAVKYIKSKEPLTLLEIAEEERKVLEPLLGRSAESDYLAMRPLSQSLGRWILELEQ